jgi:hypothetical protein
MVNAPQYYWNIEKDAIPFSTKIEWQREDVQLTVLQASIKGIEKEMIRCLNQHDEPEKAERLRAIRNEMIDVKLIMMFPKSLIPELLKP